MRVFAKRVALWTVRAGRFRNARERPAPWLPGAGPAFLTQLKQRRSARVNSCLPRAAQISLTSRGRSPKSHASAKQGGEEKRAGPRAQQHFEEFRRDPGSRQRVVLDRSR